MRKSVATALLLALTVVLAIAVPSLAADDKKRTVYGELAYNKLVDPKYTPHGSLYSHFDCSSCLVVARILGERMNSSLKEHSGSFVVSHRQDTLGKDARRRAYRDSDLRTIEVLENLCEKSHFDRFTMRFNNKTKTRAYHLVTVRDMMEADRPSMREDMSYPPNEPFTVEKVTDLMLSIGMYYNANEHQHLRHLTGGGGSAAQQLCVNAQEDFEDELSAIVKGADTLTEVEYYLCGLDRDATAGFTSRPSPDFSTGEDGEPLSKEEREERYQQMRETERNAAKERFPLLEKPAVPVCGNPDAIARGAYMELLRWRMYDNKIQGGNVVIRPEREMEVSEEYEGEIERGTDL